MYFTTDVFVTGQNKIFYIFFQYHFSKSLNSVLLTKYCVER